MCTGQRNVCKNNRAVYGCTICCPSQLRHEAIYHHRLLVYHLFYDMTALFGASGERIINSSPVQYKSVAGNIACPLILHFILSCCYCSCLFSFSCWSLMALWKMGLIIYCAVWVIMLTPTGFGLIAIIYKLHIATLEDCNHWSDHCWRCKAINHSHVLLQSCNFPLTKQVVCLTVAAFTFIILGRKTQHHLSNILLELTFIICTFLEGVDLLQHGQESVEVEPLVGHIWWKMSQGGS